MDSRLQVAFQQLNLFRLRFRSFLFHYKVEDISGIRWLDHLVGSPVEFGYVGNSVDDKNQASGSMILQVDLGL